MATHRAETTYYGEVRAADLNSRFFVVRLQDGRNVRGRLEERFRATITQALHERQLLRLNLQGEISSDPDAGEYQFEEIEALAKSEEIGSASELPWWERLAALGAAVPEAEWKDQPTDMARRDEYYLDQSDHSVE